MPSLLAVAIDEQVAEVDELTAHLTVLDLDVAQRRAQHRVPS